MPFGCPRCRSPVPRRIPAPIRWSVVLVAWGATLFCVGASILTGPTILAELPILIPLGIGMVTGAHVFAFRDLTCPACGCAVE